MSTPPSSSTARSNERATDPSSVTLQVTARTESGPKSAAISRPRLLERFGVDVGKHHRGAFADQTARGRLADAARASGDIGDAAGEWLGLGSAPQLGFFEPPVLDVERFLLVEPHVLAHRGCAAHDMNGVDVEFTREARGGLVASEAQQADPGTRKMIGFGSRIGGLSGRLHRS